MPHLSPSRSQSLIVGSELSIVPEATTFSACIFFSRDINKPFRLPFVFVSSERTFSFEVEDVEKKRLCCAETGALVSRKRSDSLHKGRAIVLHGLQYEYVYVCSPNVTH